MYGMSLLVFLLSLLVTAGLAIGQPSTLVNRHDQELMDLTFGINGLRDRFPWNISAPDWAGMMSQPDLTGVFPINGFNISADSRDRIDGWTISLSVRQNVWSEGVRPKERTDTIFNAAELRLNPPESLLGPVEAAENGQNGTFVRISSPSWEVCSTFFRLEMSRDVYVDDDERPCSGLFSEACLEALDREVLWTNGPCLRMDRVALPEECERPPSMFAYNNDAPQKYRSWDDVVGEEAARDVDWLYGSEMASSASRAWPNDTRLDIADILVPFDYVMVVWMHNSSDSEDDRRTASRSIVCPKSLKTTDDGESSATRLVPVLAAVFISLLATV